jgi:hypothetical protein
MLNGKDIAGSASFRPLAFCNVRKYSESISETFAGKNVSDAGGVRREIRASAAVERKARAAPDAARTSVVNLGIS